jgi:hypothetical protein
MFTGLSDLYHKVNTSSMVLPAKLMEEYIMRAISRAENGEGAMLLKSFQSQLRFMKHMDAGWATDEARYRRVLYNCCDQLATEDNNVPLLTNSYPPSTQPASKHSNTGRGRMEHANLAEANWEVYDDMIEEYTALATAVAPPQQLNTRPAGRNMQQRGDRNTREEYFINKFCTKPCACCGSKNHPMLSPMKDSDGMPLECNYVCPAAMFTNWQEQRKTRSALRFQPEAKKFAAMCHNDSSVANSALQEYEQVGSGQYRSPQDRLTFKTEVLKNCKTSSQTSDYRKNVRMSGVDECHSSIIYEIRNKSTR